MATVSSTLRATRDIVRLLATVQVTPPFPTVGPHPVEDSSGVSIAIAMLLKSLSPGRYEGYQQYETIRKLRAGFSNVFQASLAGGDSFKTMGGGQSEDEFFKFLSHPVTLVREVCKGLPKSDGTSG
jgi:hypothetical protein